MEYVFQTPGRIYFIMQYVRGGELFKQLSEKKRLPEANAKFYATQIALALGHLHKNKIIYRDVKPENILIDETGYIFLTDFGMAKFLNEDQTANSFCGTPEYLAPEIITGEGHNKAVDWWSLGIILYEMIVGIPPFYHQNQKVMFEFIRSKTIIFPGDKYNIPISEECKDIISKFLIKDQKTRLGSKGDLEEVLAHPFFKSIDITKLYNKQIEAPFIPPPVEIGAVTTSADPSLSKEVMATAQIPESKLKQILVNQEKFKDFSS
jgi:serum/glucocorticoid-regulated kinase 2